MTRIPLPKIPSEAKHSIFIGKCQARSARLAVHHRRISNLIYAPEKPLNFSAPILVRLS
jgi:hypothetical protein